MLVLLEGRLQAAHFGQGLRKKRRYRSSIAWVRFCGAAHWLTVLFLRRMNACTLPGSDRTLAAEASDPTPVLDLAPGMERGAWRDEIVVEEVRGATPGALTAGLHQVDKVIDRKKRRMNQRFAPGPFLRGNVWAHRGRCRRNSNSHVDCNMQGRNGRPVSAPLHFP